MKKLNLYETVHFEEGGENRVSELTVPFGGLHTAPEGISTQSRAGKQQFKMMIVADDQADDPYGVRRLRMALKVLRRRFGLRCVSAELCEDRKPNPDGDYSYRFE